MENACHEMKTQVGEGYARTHLFIKRQYILKMIKCNSKLKFYVVMIHLRPLMIMIIVRDI